MIAPNLANRIFIMKALSLLVAILPLILAPTLALAAADDFFRKGAGPEYYQATIDAFNLSVLGDMLFNFYAAMRDEQSVFTYLMAAGDKLLAPLLAPLIVICLGTRLMQDMKDDSKDIFAGVYATAMVVLIIAIYRTVMSELALASNAMSTAINPIGYGFEDTMREIEGVVEFYNDAKKNKDPIALLVDKSLSVFTEYFAAWGSKWGVMVMYGLLNYLRSTLFAINYVLGIFLLPFFIIKQNSLPKNWVMITAFILLWGVIETVMIAVMGKLGIAALKASVDIDAPLPIFSESLFYIMVTTVNILIGVAMLSSIWIVKSYLLSPSAISSAAAFFVLPAISLAYMTASLGGRGALAATGVLRSTTSGVKSGRGKGGGRSHMPTPADIFGTRRSPSQPNPSKGKPGRPKGSGKSSSAEPATKPSLRRQYRMRTILEHNGRLDRANLPANITAISRVGKKHKFK